MSASVISSGTGVEEGGVVAVGMAVVDAVGKELDGFSTLLSSLVRSGVVASMEVWFRTFGRCFLGYFPI